MKIDGGIVRGIREASAEAATLEGEGYDGLWVAEIGHDPFLYALQVANGSTRVSVGTAIAVAFGHTPMSVAASGYDLAAYSEGRFILGLGSQIKPHIERRYSMPWSKPAARMREYVLALRAIWAAWHEGAPLRFEGEFYTHTLMTPFFAPPRHEWGPPPVYVAGVGEKMTETAGEVGDGFFVHPFSTVEYLREVTLPALARGRAKAGEGDLQGFVVNGPAFVVTGRDDDEMATAAQAVKERIAFYGSTPSYYGVFELHGRADVGPKLTQLSKEGRWAEMGDLIDDDFLQTMAVVAEPAHAGRAIVERWGGIYDRLTLYVPYELDPSSFAEVVTAVRSGS
jgi:probable F420-dependent oxidoreductase